MIVLWIVGDTKTKFDWIHAGTVSKIFGEELSYGKVIESTI